MTKPVGGTTIAAMLACQRDPVGLGVAPSLVAGHGRWRPTAATRSVPKKLTQPCIAVPGIWIAPAQTNGELAPGQKTPHVNAPGTR